MGALASYIMQNRMQAIMVASGFGLLSLIFPPVSIVSSATVALVTLRLGAAEGGYVFGSAALASALLGFFLIGNYQLPLLYGLMLWIPIWLIAIVLREGRSLFLAIEIVITIAILAVVAAYFYQPNLAQVWEAQLVTQLKPMLLKANPEMSVAEIEHSLSVFYRFVMTGLLALIYVIGLLIGLFLGRGWQAILYNPGGFKKEYLALQGQPKLAVATLAITAVAWIFSGVIAEICWNIGILLFILYAFIGTIILHCVFATLKQKDFLVPMLYVTMIFIPYALLPAAILGLVDTWLNLRKKIPNQTSVENA